MTLRNTTPPPLQKLNKVSDWDLFRPKLESGLNEIYAKRQE
jgi:hypothetical protein